MAASNDDIFRQAITSFQAGRLDEAERYLKEFLRYQPKHVAALNILSIVLTGLEKYDEAERYVKLAIDINPNSDATFYNYGVILKALNRLVEALQRFGQALAINPAVAETWNCRGTVFNDLKRYDDAIKDFDNAIALQPNYSAAIYNRGNACYELKRADDALMAFDKALALTPSFAEAWLGRGNACYDLKRHEEALSAFDRALALKPDLAAAWLGRGNACHERKRCDEALAAFDKALALRPDLAEAWLGRGNAFYELKRYDEALAAYEKALALKPGPVGAWLGCGNVFYELKRYDEALVAYDKALALKADLVEAWLGRGNAFYELKRYDPALAGNDLEAYEKALTLNPSLAEAWLGCGNVFVDLKRYDKAFAAFDRAFALKPDLISVEGSRLFAKMSICHWSNLDAECAHLISSVRNGNVNTSPFPFLIISSRSDDRLQCARLWVSRKFPAVSDPIWRGEKYNHSRIRVAYLSADFHQHATSYLIAGMFECHDKSRFEIMAISYGPADPTEMRARLKASNEHFIEAGSYSDYRIARLVRESEIDILVDLKGFTANSRTSILSRRPAPIQVNYLGFPGTMGAKYVDYIVADRFVIPEHQRDCYAEKIVSLPNCYQVNDAKRAIAERAFTRPELGLPPSGFVFCCFNNNYKITPRMFDCWMRILKQVDGGVLWLLEDSAAAATNLKKEAAARGVNAERLIFAKRIPLSEHLARHRAADLFIDTLPCNAHTTASDALWAGLPVLTCLGDTFAGRVAGSLLHAIRLPELITTTQESYEQLAIELSANPEKLSIIKRKLADNRLVAPLFDTKLLTRHIEAGYEAMYERHQSGLPPDQIMVANS